MGLTLQVYKQLNNLLRDIARQMHVSILLSITNKMKRYAIFLIAVNALHVSGGFSVHHQELKNCTHSMWYM
jgi:hypothetical protein